MSGGVNYLYGDAGNDFLHGGGAGGNDELDGGLGQDTLWGGAGADTFIFDEGDASPMGTPDVVKDFSGSGGDGDKLDLSELTETEDGTALRVEYRQFGQTGSSTAKTIVQVDLDGDGVMETGEDFQLELTGHHDLSAADFVFEGGSVSVVEVTDIVLA